VRDSPLAVARLRLYIRAVTLPASTYSA